MIKSDIEIAQSTEQKPIEEIAKKIGINREILEFYGNYKAKIDYKHPQETGKLKKDEN